MVLKITIEAIVYSALYSLFLFVLFKVKGAVFELYNYPPAIKKRAVEIGVTTEAEMAANAKRCKIIGLAVMLIESLVIICGVNRETTFWSGFYQSYIFFNAFSLVDAAIIDTLYFCHSKWWIIPGTEDMTDAYHDYAFHWKWFFVGLISSLILSAIVGGITVLVGMLY